jgi:hypothetical protein
MAAITKATPPVNTVATLFESSIFFALALF